MYRLGAMQAVGRTFGEALAHRAKSLLGKTTESKECREEFWALRDINLDIQQGQVTGIIGRNGAGKSTLLKILSRITDPTEGRAEVRGRVASLLEVGTGFHPELSGRENIFLNGTILGMKRSEIREHFDDIVDFAEMGKFIDTPVKRYSSGMYVRLAFAVAAFLQPEVLIIDEVLAVGDVTFQQRCLGRMREVAEGGRTVLFVSHQLGAVRTLCSRCVMLEHGNIVADGDTPEVVNRYLRGGEEVGDSLSLWQANQSTAQIRNDVVELTQVQLQDASGKLRGQFSRRESVKLQVRYRVTQPETVVRTCLQWVAANGSVAFTSVDEGGRAPARGPGDYVTECEVPAELLNIGQYDVVVALDHPHHRLHISPIATVRCEISDPELYRLLRRVPDGAVFPNLRWRAKSA